MNQERDHIIQEVIYDHTAKKFKGFVALATLEEVLQVLSKAVPADMLEEIEHRGHGSDLDVLLDHAGDDRQTFGVWSKDKLRLLDRSEDLGDIGELGSIDIEVWKAAEAAGWLDNNESTDEGVDA